MKRKCLRCETLLLAHQSKYCSNVCQKEYEHEIYIKEWRAGRKSGVRGKNAKNISRHLVRYLFEKYKARCSSCGWSVVHSQTMTVPLEVDHIDGNAENNVETNLRLLCPNCHSLTINYRNLNKGKGRLWRREKYVKIVKMPL